MALAERKHHIGWVQYDEPNPRKRLYIILAVIAAVLLLVGGLAARPAYHWFKQWRALQLVEASAQAMQDKDLKTASEKANAAMRLWAYDARILRQEAKVFAATQNPAALPMWMQTWSYSHDLADLREVIESALYEGNNPIAVEQFAVLQKAQPQDPATWLLEGKIRLTQNQIPEALAEFKKVLDAGKAPPDAHLLYAKTAVLSGDPTQVHDGLEHLRTLTERTDELGLEALRLLGNFPALSAGEAEPIAKKLQSHPLATGSDKLLALHLLGEVPGANEESLLKTARELFPANDPGALHSLGTWLMHEHKYAAVLQLVDSQTALTREDLFLLRADAMAATGQWEAIGRELKLPKLPLPEEERLLLEARVQTELGQGASAELAWERIRNNVADQPQKLLNVAMYAMHLSLFDVARPAFEELRSRPDQRRTAYEQLTLIERRTGHTKALHLLLLDMAKVYPNDLVVRNDVLYTGFLLGEAGAEQIDAARKLVSDSKAPFLSFRVTLALGLLTAGQPAEALKAFDGVTDSTWPAGTNSWNAVYVGVLRANGQREKASHLEQSVHPDNLLTEEKTLLLTPLPPETMQ